MCGLFGVFYPRAGTVDPERLLRYARLMKSRGPDGEGWWTDDQRKIGLAFQRLAIIDLEMGHQPMATADGNHCIVFNGEIYNYRELRAHLQSKGYVFRTRSDTEVILHSYAEWGTDCVDQLRGMFAFALADLERKRIIVARDRSGIKPLYYLQYPSLVAFSSELKPLVCLARDEKLFLRMNLDAVSEYLRWGYVPSPMTPYHFFFKLPPASVGVISWEEDPHQPVISTYRYWRFPWESGLGLARDWKERLVGVVSDAVRAHLVADVPVGAFLSGGLDSSAVVALAARELQRSAQPALQTFSVIIRAFGFSEARYMRAIARAFPVVANEFTFTLKEMQDSAPKVPEIYDEPFADASAIPTYMISRVAREAGMKTVLSGDGGDEIFGGYGRYVKALFAMRRKSEEAVIEDFLNGMRWFKEDEVKSLVPDARTPPDGQAIHLAVLEQNKHLPLLTRLQDLDLQTYLPENNLTKVDRASMAHSLEVRIPLLDRSIAEVVGALPEPLRVSGRLRKVALRVAMEGILPPIVLHRGKRGFSVPLAQWLRGPFRKHLEDRVLSGIPADLVPQETLERMLKSFLRQGKKGATKLWNLYCLACWMGTQGK